jgi:hypothetical protein
VPHSGAERVKADYPVVLPFAFPPDRLPSVSQVRSTLIAVSLRVLREKGWEDRYFAALPKARHEEIKLLTAGVWVPNALAMDHYRACDAMRLSPVEMEAIGESVSERTSRAFIGTLGKAATGAGLNPWHFLKSSHRIWARMMNGGDCAVYEVGPKEALVVLAGCPLVEITYFRVGIVAYYRAITRVLSRTVYTREVREHARKDGVAFRLSWV